jgi:hypothetical protein
MTWDKDGWPIHQRVGCAYCDCCGKEVVLTCVGHYLCPECKRGQEYAPQEDDYARLGVPEDVFRGTDRVLVSCPDFLASIGLPPA